MANPIHIVGYDHIVLRIADKDAMLAFYCGVLGLTVDRDRPELGLTHIRLGPQMIDLVTLGGPLGGTVPPDPATKNLDHFCLQVRPFDEAAIRAHLATHGIAPVEEGQRYGADGTGFSVYIQDPEGNLVELKGPSQ
jgi:glyoxylase I family protein